MAFTLTEAQIETALPRVAPGLGKYLWLQTHLAETNVGGDLAYRKRFNGFYRVRRSREWQDKFYELLETSKGRPVRFGDMLSRLHQATGRIEASFASKLVATIEPNMPVIDSIVLRNLDLRLPAYASADRTARLEQLHATLARTLQSMLATDAGRYLVQRFRGEYPDADITAIKMLDLVLWQTRPIGDGGADMTTLAL